jgi:hypothetical protein
MLEALGAPDPVKGTENDLTRRIRVLFKQTGVLMILIDEFQHFFDRGKKQIMHNVADWLKILVDDTGVTLVVAGLPTCLDVIDTNEQLAGRLSSPIHFKRFEWRDDGDRGQYMDLLAAFHKQLQPEYDVPIFDSEEMAFRFWQATGGLIGYLAKLLRQAERNAVTNKKKQITMADLHTAHMESVWMAQRLPDLPRPFLSSSLAEPTADLLERVAQIGTASEATPISNRLRVRSPKRETLHKLLGKR